MEPHRIGSLKDSFRAHSPDCYVYLRGNHGLKDQEKGMPVMSRSVP